MPSLNLEDEPRDPNGWEYSLANEALSAGISTMTLRCRGATRGRKGMSGVVVWLHPRQRESSSESSASGLRFGRVEIERLLLVLSW